jgi:hypothetical protein
MEPPAWRFVRGHIKARSRIIRRTRQLFLLVALPLAVCAASSDTPEEDSLQQTPAVGYYERCGEAIGISCGDGLQCVIFGSHETGLCLSECESAMDCTYARCPFGTVCDEHGAGHICADW